MIVTTNKNGHGVGVEVSPPLGTGGSPIMARIRNRRTIDILEYMRMSVDVMRKSVQERRVDSKPSPYVGAVIVMPNGDVDTAYRGELREGDHAEFTLLERKHRSDNVAGSILFATLEPCAPGARNFPKLGCAERIVNARIKKVYIGIEDPDPTVSRKGIAYLLENGVEVEMYPQDLQKEIEEVNKEFLTAARERARIAAEEKPAEAPVLTNNELVAEDVDFSDLDQELLGTFLRKAGLVEADKNTSDRYLAQLGVIENKNGKSAVTGIGYLLFGKNPQLKYQQARVLCVYRTSNGKEDIFSVEGPLLEQPDKLFKWYASRIGGHLDRSKPERQKVYNYPMEVFNELIKNAILHRDYDLEGAPIYLEVTDDAVIIKSPGLPVKPIKLGQIQNFSAPSLSRNPKIIFAFDKMDLAEQRGLGFQTVRDLRPKYNIPLPIVTYEDPYIVFTLPLNSQSKSEHGLTENEQRVVELLRLNGPTKRTQIERELSREKKSVGRILQRLKNRGLIKTIGCNRSIQYLVQEDCACDSNSATISQK